MFLSNQNDPSLWKGALAGLAGGLVASWTMNQFQAALSAIRDDKGDSDDGGPDEPATVKAASAVSEGVFDHELTEQEKKAAGPAVHYAFGASAGAVYGTAAEALPGVTAGAGLPFGAVFWLVADEAAVPALGLSEPPTEHPRSVHAEALAAHLVYGLTTELVRRGVRRLLS